MAVLNTWSWHMALLLCLFLQRMSPREEEEEADAGIDAKTLHIREERNVQTNPD